jgi:hypothetical protein
LGDEFVLVHLGTNRIYALNATAARLWELLEQGCTYATITEIMLREFDVDEADLWAELEALMTTLQRRELLLDDDPS